MPEEKKTTPDLNLLAEDDLDTSSQGKFIRWALTWGKRIIILTELVVIIAFLSRFWLDTESADLKEKIDNQKSIVLSFSTLEKKVKDLDSRIVKAKEIEAKTSVLTVYNASQDLIPESLNVSQTNIDTTSVSFSGKSDEKTLASLVKSFTESQNFTNVTVNTITKQPETVRIEFSFKANYGR